VCPPSGPVPERCNHFWCGDLHRCIPLPPHLRSWTESYNYTVDTHPFNDAYRYKDWFLDMPPILIEIVLVLKLSREEASSKGTSLGAVDALMIALDCPG
jgi:hypothetical protein